MRNFIKKFFVVVIAGIIIYIILGSFRYKNYLYSDYIFMLKDKGKIYKLENEIQLVGDRLTGENYILLGLSKNWTYGHEVKQIFMLANSNYKIKETNSKFYDGIIQMDYSKKVPVKLTEVEDEISLHKKEKIEIVDIDYKGKKESIILSTNNKNPKFKSFRFWISTRKNNGYSHNNPKGYGLSFQKLKVDFDLNLSIEIDNRKKIVYLIKE